MSVDGAVPAVSVLVPCYNDAPYLDQALESIANQSLRDLEAVICDDASSDHSPSIAAAWAARDRRFRLVRNSTNLGMNRNWNRALSLARGELVLKLDADDAMTPRTLELLRAEFVREPSLLFSACRTLDCDPDLTVIGPYSGDLAFGRHGLDPERALVQHGLNWLRMCFDDIQLWVSDAQMYRRLDLVALGGWDERWMASDTDLILRALALDRLVAHLPELGILYRRRVGSASERERQSGAARIELGMIALRVLSATRTRLRPFGRPLRQNWWRIWRRFRRDRRDESLWTAVPESRRRALAALAEATERLRPPLWIRIEGELRWRAWRLKEAARSIGRARAVNESGNS